jgi:hypothetical protein
MRAVLMIIAFALSGCPRPGPSPVPPAPPAFDAAERPATCSETCQHLDVIGCQNGGACLAVCTRIKSQRVKNCLRSAPSCEIADGCDQ